MWLGDFYLTIKTVKKIGPKAEINPIMRSVLGFRGKHVYLFKIVELGLFLYLIYFLSNFNGVVPFYTLLGYILFYSLLVANNSHVLFKVTKEETLTLNYIFVGVTICTILFIYLNYLMFADLLTTYTAISQCHISYNQLYQTCNQNTTMISKLPENLLDVIKSLDIKIPMP